jgi:hypothetical protein
VIILEPPPGRRALNLGQQATRVAGTTATQITATVVNSSSETAKNVVVTVKLMPILPDAKYSLIPGSGWKTANFAGLHSQPITLAAGKAQTFSFQIAPIREEPAVTITSTAAATTTNPDITAASNQIHAVIGG